MTPPAIDFADLVRDIVASYVGQPLTRHIDAGRLASHEALVELVLQFRELLFPGYFGKQGLASRTVEYHVGELLVDLHARLVEQVHNAILHQAARDGTPIADGRTGADEIVRGVLEQIPRLRAVLATDVHAAFDGDPAAGSTDEIIFSYPGFFAITVYRIAHEFYLRGVPLIPRIMTEYAHSVTGIDIHPGASIDEFFFIDHGTGVVIGQTTVIGKRVKIYQGVTLGALSTRGGQSLRGTKRHPTLEDDVTVYPNASILGGETIIGAGVTIGANVFVTQSVPPRTRVTVKNPELQYRDHAPKEFKQAVPATDWVI